MKSLKNFVTALYILIGTSLAWQAMNEFYKFDKADLSSAFREALKK